VSVGGERFVDPLGSTPNVVTGQAANKTATAAVVMGSISVAIAWIPFVVVAGATLAVLALVFGIRGLRRSRGTGVGRGSSIAGIVMGVLGLAASVVGVIFSVMVWREIAAFADPGPVSTEVVGCRIDGRNIDVTGTVTNLDGEAHDYTLFVDVDGRRDVVIVESVGPDTTVEWDAQLTTSSVSSGCEPEIIVQGPFPFGVEVDPIAN
jgi:fermentation-respiration switch protein FrsA (DUF1100 family)